MADKVPAVYAAIAKIIGEIGAEGIQKTRKNNQGGGYSYRGVDDVLNALNPLLAKHGLVIVPQVVRRECDILASKSGGTLRYVCLTVDYEVSSAVDGSQTTARVVGEAFDSGDKATAKALSMAYKYLCFQLFAIPIVGASHDNETDSDEPIPPGAWERTPASPAGAPMADAEDARLREEERRRVEAVRAREPGAATRKGAGAAGQVRPGPVTAPAPATPPLPDEDFSKPDGPPKAPPSKPPAAKPSPPATPADRRKPADAVKSTAARTGLPQKKITAAVVAHVGKAKDYTVREVMPAQVFLAKMEAPKAEVDELREGITELLKSWDPEEADGVLAQAGLLEPYTECLDVQLLRDAYAALKLGGKQ